MKNKIVKIIKTIISKVILPIQKKRDEWLGNFRFSIAFRISLHYLKLLLISGIFFMMGIIILFYASSYQSKSNKLVKTIIDIGRSGQLQVGNIVNPLNIDYINLMIKDENGEIIYNDIEFDISKEHLILNRIYISFDKGILEPIITIMDERTVEYNKSRYIMYVQYDMEDTTEQVIWLIGAIGLLYLFISFMIIRRGKISDLKLLEPITEMSNIANKLTGNNLHNHRLNVEGTKNELKDLAIVINNMLDRIELSYESQKQFVSDASHELRTPISVVQGYAGLLKRWGTRDEEVLIESVEAISNESKAMQDLVEKLLFLSRHDKKTLKLEKRKFYMNRVIEDMVRETKLVTNNRIIKCDKLEEVIVYADRQSIKQAIRVFIDNAVKYSKDGDTITINCENDNGDCIITVADTGIGMKRKDAEHIFERFYRSDNVRDEKINGHGLGLSIAKLIILGHTGIIRVKTQFKKGTTFTIILPKRY